MNYGWAQSPYSLRIDRFLLCMFFFGCRETYKVGCWIKNAWTIWVLYTRGEIKPVSWWTALPISLSSRSERLDYYHINSCTCGLVCPETCVYALLGWLDNADCKVIFSFCVTFNIGIGHKSLTLKDYRLIAALDRDLRTMVSTRFLHLYIPSERYSAVGRREFQTDSTIQSQRCTAGGFLTVWALYRHIQSDAGLS